MNPEEWREIPGFWGYEVSSHGNVRSWRVPRWRNKRAVKPHPVKLRRARGYNRVFLQDSDEKSKPFQVHRLVALMFIGTPPSDAHEIGHKNDDKTDNRAENLEWVTRQQNIQQRNDRSRQAWGSAVNTAKLKPDDVRAIRRAVTNGLRNCDLARSFGVSHAAISSIVKGRSWRMLPVEEAG